MTDVTNDLMYELLKKIQSDIGDLKQGQRDLKMRIGFVETALANQSTQLASLNSRLDHFEDRLERIERRLELVEA